MTPLQELTERPRAAGPVRALVCLSDAICRQRASSESPPRVRETLCVLSRGSLRGSRRFRPQGKEWEGADPQAVALSRLLPHRLCARKNRAVSARGSLLTPLAVLSCAIFLTLHSNLFSSICIGAAGVRVLEVARQGALSSTAAAEHGQVPQDAPLPPRAAWLCRMAYNGEGCGSAVNAALGTSGAFCDKDQCCPISSSKCTNTSGFCVDSSSLQQGHSWGKCNRTQCARCGPNASCAFVASTSLTRGGVYCKCDPPFVGTGATCEMEACKEANPCGSGTCVPSTEPGRQYSCQCNPGYVEVMSGVATSHATCVNLCEHSGCSQSPGVEACIGGVNSHLCICKHGYRLSVDRSTGSTQCVLND
ncbi:egf family domain-containing protein, partial [Cystoisospora suis]